MNIKKAPTQNQRAILTSYLLAIQKVRKQVTLLTACHGLVWVILWQRTRTQGNIRHRTGSIPVPGTIFPENHNVDIVQTDLECSGDSCHAVTNVVNPPGI